MVPADKKIYALRDATATVESNPLIASSVMSKKLAAGADAILLDVKVGKGAFVATVDSARSLASAMVEIGVQLGKKTIALVTRMDQPLGNAVGDCVEMMEAIFTLRGEGPPDFVELCELVTAYMLVLGGAAKNYEQGRELAKEGLSRGVGLEKLRQLIKAQDGDTVVIDDPETLLSQVERRSVTATREGFVLEIDSRRIGWALRDYKKAADRQKRLCGVLLHKKEGDHVTVGESLATVLGPATTSEAIQTTTSEVLTSYRLGETQPPKQELLIDVLGI